MMTTSYSCRLESEGSFCTLTIDDISSTDSFLSVLLCWSTQSKRKRTSLFFFISPSISLIYDMCKIHTQIPGVKKNMCVYIYMCK
jgi:hypothetical protein